MTLNELVDKMSFNDKLIKMCGELARTEYFQTLDEAVNCLEIRWAQEKKQVKKIVWRSMDA